MTDLQAAADTLRRLALDERLKARIAADPDLTTLLRKAARRYVSGTRREEAIERVRAINAAGHAATVDYMGESTREHRVGAAAITEFLGLTETIAASGVHASVSLDLSHLGSQLDRSLGLASARRLAAATRDAGIEMHLSMEGHDRVQQILDDHATLCAEFDHVGITVAARLHRTATDLPRLLDRPGRIRLIKGAYDTPRSLAADRGSPELAERFDEYAESLLRSGHPCAIATHDVNRIEHARRFAGGDYYFEVLQGIGDELAADLHGRGHPTQVYVVYGTQEWLYLCNRLAEDPLRVLQAVVDLAELG